MTDELHEHHEPNGHHVCRRPDWWLPHILFAVSAVGMTVAVVLLVILGLIRGQASEHEHEQDDCQALHDGVVYETGAESRRAINVLLVEIVNQQVTGAFSAERFPPIIARNNAAFLAEQRALDDREAFLAAGRPVPCVLQPAASASTTTLPLPTLAPSTLAPSTSTSTTQPRPTTSGTSTSLPAITTSVAAVVTTILRPSTTLRPPTPIPTQPTATTTTTTIDCPGRSEQCNRPHPTHPRDR